jgi:hypothetical protein
MDWRQMPVGRRARDTPASALPEGTPETPATMNGFTAALADPNFAQSC